MYSFDRFTKESSRQKKISMVTCYDFWAGKILNQTNVDAVLVGDSVAMVVHGFPNTIHATVEIMQLHTSAVAKGIKDKMIVTDLPFLSTRASIAEAVAAVKFVMQAGAHAVKIEGADGHLELIKHLVQSGVPVMGHLGLTPQSVFTMGGFKVQGRSADQVQKLHDDALALEKAGCFSIVLECVPSAVGKSVSEELSIPTIGIGAGKYTDGQILVLHDLLGLNGSFKPKFLRHFAHGETIIVDAVNNYCAGVQMESFPGIDEAYQ